MVKTVLDDIFARKKNGTLQVRLSAMMMYVRWARSKGLDGFSSHQGSSATPMWMG